MIASSIACGLVASLFAQAAIGKFLEPDSLSRSVTYVLGLHRRAQLLVVIIATVELSLTVLLVLPQSRAHGAIGLAAFGVGIVLFAVAARVRGQDFDCGCFGALGVHAPPGWRHVGVGLLTAAAMLLVSRSASAGVPSSEIVPAVAGASCGLILPHLVRSSSQLRELARRPILEGIQS